MQVDYNKKKYIWLQKNTKKPPFFDGGFFAF